MRQGVSLALLFCVSAAASAQVHVSKPGASASAAPGYHRSPSQTPKECSQPSLDPWLAALCKTITRGKPQASDEVVTLPAHGTPEAKRSGYACVGGLAMRRLQNGWEQVRDSRSNFVRCVDR